MEKHSKKMISTRECCGKHSLASRNTQQALVWFHCFKGCSRRWLPTDLNALFNFSYLVLYSKRTKFFKTKLVYTFQLIRNISKRKEREQGRCWKRRNLFCRPQVWLYPLFKVLQQFLKVHSFIILKTDIYYSFLIHRNSSQFFLEKK